MSQRPVINLLVLICGFAASAQAIDYSDAPVWDRASAMAAVRSVDIEPAVFEISNISTLADATTTLNRLRGIETRGDWPLPAREAAIYQFTRSLAEFPRDAVAVEIMQHLLTYQARTLVPHEEHSEAAVPLFNIRAAASGVQNGWQRAESAAEAGVLLGQNPQALVSAFLRSASYTTRAGYLDALRHADMADIRAVQSVALENLRDAPELTRLVGVTATISGDTDAARQLLIHGEGEGLVSALKSIGDGLPRTKAAGLLVIAIQQAPASNASLAIAAWWPLLRHEPAVRELLLDTLADPSLGSAAALALAKSPDIQTIKALQDKAAGDSIAAQRARMALDINRDLLAREMQP